MSGLVRTTAAERDERIVQRLASERYDLVIVGGGVHGAFAAWQAARWGWKVALLERDDFGAGTSANSLKIAHGGLRYLQNMDVARLRASVRERSALHAIAPALVRPLPCVLPTRGMGARSRAALTVALRANDVLSAGASGSASGWLPRGRTIGPSEYRDLAGPLAVEGSSGAALWYDGLIESPERLVVAVVLAAERDGATVLNHAEAVSITEAHGRAAGVRVRHHAGDPHAGDPRVFTVQTPAVLVTAGPWAQRVTSGDRGAMVRACNVVLDIGEDRLPRVAAALPLERERRMLFAVPWSGRLMVGTSYSVVPESESPDRALAGAGRDLDTLLADTVRAAPASGASRHAMSLAHVGLLPGTAGRHGAAPLDRPVLMHHGDAGGVAGVVSLQGVKWTTARMAAREALMLCARVAALVRPSARDAESELHDVLVPEGSATDIAARVAFLPGRAEREGGQAGRIAARLSRIRGGTSGDVLALASGEPQLARVLEGGDVLAAEVAHAIRREHARTLSDLMLRRMELGTAGRPEAGLANEVARVAASELGWNDARREREVEALFSRYGWFTTSD